MDSRNGHVATGNGHRMNGHAAPGPQGRTHRMSQLLKWLVPGLRVKRWFALAVAGGVVVGVCASLLREQPGLAARLGATAGMLAGIAVMFTGLVRTIRSLLDAVRPVPAGETELVDVLVQRRSRQRGIKVVAIGGGTGLSTLLSGLKSYTENISAIVTVGDDGGSSGRLRRELGILPPGDIRNCLVALADTEPLMQRLFQHRFSDGGLRGHNFGNLFIAALTEITGDFESAVHAASRVLAIRGHVIPSTCGNAQLVAEHPDGTRTVGESKISEAVQPIRRLRLEPADLEPTAEALAALREADLIILGPGSLYTSLLPNLLIPGVVEAIVQSSALKVYVCNVMTQFRETHGFTGADHVRALIAHTHPGLIQVCALNAGYVPDELLAKYRSEDAVPVEPDVERIRAMGYQVIVQDFMSTENFVRHDPDKLASELIELKLGTRPEHVLQLNGWTPPAVAARPVPHEDALPAGNGWAASSSGADDDAHHLAHLRS